MPFALIAAMLASVGIHAAALFLPDLEHAVVAAEPFPLQAEIVLQPRQAPLPVAEEKPASARRPAPPVQAVRKTPPKPQTKTPVMATEKDSLRAAPVVAASALSGVGTALLPPAVSEARPAVAAAEVSSPGLPATGSIEYVVISGDPPAILGSAEHQWEMKDGRYRILSVMETTGIAALLKPVRLETESTGKLVASGLKPDRYVSRRVVREKSEQIDFDWAAGVARLSRGGSIPLPEGTQDLLSFNYQLGWLARTGDMVVATTRKLGTYRLELLGKEWLDTPAGPIWTLHFRAVGETTTEVWLASEQYLLPVKIQHIDKKGERFAQLAREIRLSTP